ncbi:MAG: glycosyltransferase family 4 protein [Bacteroidaceae bacterium]|nr:glycosyltransferase family 4 protein [Bacteroidaceae bacterium]
MMKTDKHRIYVTGTRGIPGIMGGVETHCEELFPRLVEMGFEATVFRRLPYAVDAVKSFKGVDIVDIPCTKNKFLEAFVHTFKAIVKTKRCGGKYIHIHAIGPVMLSPLARLLGMKVVFTHHGHDYDRAKWNTFAKMCLKMGEWLGCRCANHIIVISKPIQDVLAEKYGRTKNVHLIYNGVPDAQLCDDDTYFSELGIEPGKYVLALGRFVPEKNFDQLIDAFSSIRSNGCKLVIGGSFDHQDEYAKELVTKAQKNDVVLPGFVKGDHLHALLTHARCFVLPSSHEGLPISMLEAMSYRLPVIASDIPANLEVNLDADCYFKCGDTRQLAHLLQQAVENDCRRINYDMNPYNWDRIAEQTAQVYHSLMQNKN